MRILFLYYIGNHANKPSMLMSTRAERTQAEHEHELLSHLTRARLHEGMTSERYDAVQ